MRIQIIHDTSELTVQMNQMLHIHAEININDLSRNKWETIWMDECFLNWIFIHNARNFLWARKFQWNIKHFCSDDKELEQNTQKKKNSFFF